MDWLVVRVDCTRVKWLRRWLEDKPFCGYFLGISGYLSNIFGIGWLLGLIAQGLSGCGGGWEGGPYCRQVKCNIFGID